MTALVDQYIVINTYDFINFILGLIMGFVIGVWVYQYYERKIAYKIIDRYGLLKSDLEFIQDVFGIWENKK